MSECSREMALVGEAACLRNMGKTQARLAEQHPGSVNASPEHIAVRRLPRRPDEQAREVPNRHAELLCQPMQRHIGFEMILDHVQTALQMTRRQTARVNGRADMHLAAIGRAQISAQRHGDVVQKQRADLGGPRQRRLQGHEQGLDRGVDR